MNPPLLHWFTYKKELELNRKFLLIIVRLIGYKWFDPERTNPTAWLMAQEGNHLKASTKHLSTDYWAKTLPIYQSWKALTDNIMEYVGADVFMLPIKGITKEATTGRHRWLLIALRVVFFSKKTLGSRPIGQMSEVWYILTWAARVFIWLISL